MLWLHHFEMEEKRQRANSHSVCRRKSATKKKCLLLKANDT